MTRTPPARPASFARRLIAVALLVGTVAACSSDIGDAEPAASSSSTSTSTSSTSTSTSTSTTTTLPPTTTTTEPLVVVGGVVKVANASGIDGAAGLLTDEFAALGFDTRKATNGAGPDSDLDVSKIYVVAGSEAVARSVSRLMGGLEILPMPTPVWITGANENLADATVLVMLGHDLAGKRLAEMA